MTVETMSDEFTNASIVITGGAGGIGREVATMLAQQRGRMAILDRDRAAADSLSEEIRSLGGEARAFKIDV